jgi:hypothetical protein
VSAATQHGSNWSSQTKWLNVTKSVHSPDDAPPRGACQGIDLIDHIDLQNDLQGQVMQSL